MTRPIPPEPDLEPSATYSARLADWWRLCDVALRANHAEERAAWIGQIVPVMSPTLDRIADAWDAMDKRLGELAAAMRPVSSAPETSHPAQAPIPFERRHHARRQQ